MILKRWWFFFFVNLIRSDVRLNRTISFYSLQNSQWPNQRRNMTYHLQSNTVDTVTDSHINVSTMMLVSSIAIVVYIVLNSMREVLQIYQQKWKYLFEPNNFLSWVLYISATIMVSPVFNDGSINDVHFSATSLTVFLSWFNLLLFLQRFDQVRFCIGKKRKMCFIELLFFNRLASMWSCFWKSCRL